MLCCPGRCREATLEQRTGWSDVELGVRISLDLILLTKAISPDFSYSQGPTVSTDLSSGQPRSAEQLSVCTPMTEAGRGRDLKGVTAPAVWKKGEGFGQSWTVTLPAIFRASVSW